MNKILAAQFFLAWFKRKLIEFAGLFWAFFLGSFILTACLRLWYWVFWELWQ